MGVVVLLIGLLVVAIALWAYRLYLQRDFRTDGTDIGAENRASMQAEGLPNEASIRSGELGRAAASEVFRNFRG